jgi:hypothetical protein
MINNNANDVDPFRFHEVQSFSSIDSQAANVHNIDEPASVVSYDSDDVFGSILHPTTIYDSDKDNGANQSDVDNDVFDQLLNYCDDNNQQKTQHASADDIRNHETTTSCVPNKYVRHVQTNRRDTASDSVASVASSSGDTASVVPHWLLQKGGHYRTSGVTKASDTSSVMSAVS